MKLRDLFKGTPAHPPLKPTPIPVCDRESCYTGTDEQVTASRYNHGCRPDFNRPIATSVDEITRLTEGWDMPAAPDPQCTATTRTGNRCKLPRTTNSDKCAIHER